MVHNQFISHKVDTSAHDVVRSWSIFSTKLGSLSVIAAKLMMQK